MEGTTAGEPTAGTIARRDAPRCGLDERLGAIRERLGEHDVCVVVNEAGVVAGILRANQLGRDDGLRAEEAMLPGPSTYRPNVPIAEMAQKMTEHDLESVPVTSADGALMGVLYRNDAVKAKDAK